MVRLISAAGGSHGNAFRHNTMAMGSPEREELGGALPAFDGQATSHPLQEVPDASAPQGGALRLETRPLGCPLSG